MATTMANPWKGWIIRYNSEFYVLRCADPDWNVLVHKDREALVTFSDPVWRVESPA